MITFTKYSDFINAVKANHNVTSEDIVREPDGKSYGSRYGVRLGNNVLKNKHTGEILGYWEVTGADQIPGRGLVTSGRGNVELTAAQKQKIADERCYALHIFPDHGPAYICTGTSNSSGPWDKDSAEFARQDKYHDLEYSDEFDHGCIRIVKVKKVDGKWVKA